MWFDAHCHLQLGEQGIEAVSRARAAGVENMVCIGTDSETSREAVMMANRAGQGVFSSIGLHPHDAKNGLDSTISLLDRTIASGDKTLVAIGECGLDYYYEHSARDIQREVFIRQIELAKKHDLALVIHTRNAWDDTFAILRSEGIPSRAVVHCFTGGIGEARIALDLGLLLSFSGVVTFPKAAEVQEAACFCPVERMTIETDSPFLAPVPMRGKQNEPALVGLIGEYISELKDVQVEAFAESTSAVTKRLFGLQ